MSLFATLNMFQPKCLAVVFDHFIVNMLLLYLSRFLRYLYFMWVLEYVSDIFLHKYLFFQLLTFPIRLVIWVLMQFRIIDYFYFASLHWSPEGQAKVILFPGDPFANSDLNVFLSCCLILFSICEKSPKLLKLENVKKKKKRFRKKKISGEENIFLNFLTFVLQKWKKVKFSKMEKKSNLER